MTTTRVERIVERLKPFAVPALCLAVFFWTNWYFSPERRLLRFGENFVHGAAEDRIKADQEIWAGPLKPRVGGDEMVSSFCSGYDCDVTVLKLYSLTDGTNISLSVSVGLRPEFGRLDRWSLLPADVHWTPTNWSWSVTRRSKDLKPKGPSFHGDLGNFNEVSVALGTPGPENYMRALANQMASAIRKQPE